MGIKLITRESFYRYGSNCIVNKAIGIENGKRLELIIKRLLPSRETFLNKSLLELVIKDYLFIKTKTENAGIKVPKTYSVERHDKNNNPNLQIIESFEGNSIKDLIRGGENSNNFKYIGEVENFIFQLPEDIPLDIQPGNIVLKENELKLIDFLPPDPWKYENKSIQNELEKIFPSISKKFDYVGKKECYMNNSQRFTRFIYHFNLILREKEKNGSIKLC